MRRTRGFTLIEVMMAMAILAIALSVLVGTQSKSVVLNEHARNLTTATMLAHDQLLAIETRLLKDGFQTDVETDRGRFKDRRYDAFEWEAVIEPLDLEPEELAAQLQGQLLGTGDDAGSLAGSSAVNAQLPSMLGWVTLMVQNLSEQRVRRVTLAVKWKDLKGSHIYTLRQFIVMMEQPEGQGLQGTTPLGGTTPPIP